MTASTLALVGLGAALGACGRAALSLAMVAQLGAGTAFGTLAANGAGSLAIGLFAALTEPGGRLARLGEPWRAFVTTGLCGGFTTFSLFSLEALALAQADDLAGAGRLVWLSVTVWLASVGVGYALGTAANRRRR
jgi:fluoride exporter